MPCKKKCFFADFALQSMVETTAPRGLETSGQRINHRGSYKTIPHTGDKASLNRCGQQHRFHSKVPQEYPRTGTAKTQKLLEICQNKRYNLQPEVSNPSGSVVSTMFCKAKSAKKNYFFCLAILDHFQTKMFKWYLKKENTWTHGLTDKHTHGQIDLQKASAPKTKPKTCFFSSQMLNELIYLIFRVLCTTSIDYSTFGIDGWPD